MSKAKDNLTLADLQEYIDKKSKKESFDTALLFFSSSLSIGFTIISAILRYQDLLIFLPTLFLGWFMPIYVGYVRGSLIMDSVEERARGGIYLGIGAVLYISMVFIPIVLTDVESSFAYFLSFFFGVIIPLISVYFSIIKNYIGNKILDIFGIEPTEETDKSFFMTFMSSFFWVAFFVSLIYIMKAGNDILIDILLLVSAVGAIIFERWARLAIVSSEND
jgi:hypothetical protein